MWHAIIELILEIYRGINASRERSLAAKIQDHQERKARHEEMEKAFEAGDRNRFYRAWRGWTVKLPDQGGEHGR
jgi:hypothetical protein